MRALLVATALAAMAGSALCAERKPITDVSVDALILETQISVSDTAPHHISVVWWAPLEFWKASFSQETALPEDARKELYGVLSGVSLLAVVQADISPIGAFDFYPKDEILSGLTITYGAAGDAMGRLEPMREVKTELEIVLGQITPILKAAVGDLGTNLQFYVLNDLTPDGDRIVDPYHAGLLTVGLERRAGPPVTVSFELPLNSLYVPRKCPNGRDAHISWNFCLWSGEELQR